jgi:hypothetical protein
MFVADLLISRPNASLRANGFSFGQTADRQALMPSSMQGFLFGRPRPVPAAISGLVPADTRSGVNLDASASEKYFLLFFIQFLVWFSIAFETKRRISHNDVTSRPALVLLSECLN